MEEWKEYKLGDVSTFSQGIQVDIDKQYSEYKPGRVRFIRIVDFTKNGEPLRYIDKPRDKYLTADGDIVMIRYGSQTAGLVAKSYDGAIANNIFKIEFNNDVISNEFGYYYLSQKSIFDYLRGAQSSSTMPAITFEIAGRVPLCLPTINIQNDIVSILKSLDDKIEVNRKINENLEQQAQALFKSWFVDFEPFKNGEFVESELGMIPKGWRVGQLDEIIKEAESGSRPKGGAETDGTPSIGAEKIERFGVYDYSGEKYINRNYYTQMKRGHVKDGDVLLYKDGAYTGKSSMALDGFPYKECAVNEHVFLLRTETSRFQFYLYFLISYPDIKKMIHTLASAKAAQPGLNQKELLGLDITIPNEDIIKQFNDLISPYMHQIANNAKESRRLAILRETLLPKLMSGEIKVLHTELINGMLEKGIK